MRWKKENWRSRTTCDSESSFDYESRKMRNARGSFSRITHYLLQESYGSFAALWATSGYLFFAQECKEVLHCPQRWPRRRFVPCWDEAMGNAGVPIWYSFRVHVPRALQDNRPSLLGAEKQSAVSGRLDRLLRVAKKKQGTTHRANADAMNLRLVTLASLSDARTRDVLQTIYRALARQRSRRSWKLLILQLLHLHVHLQVLSSHLLLSLRLHRHFLQPIGFFCPLLSWTIQCNSFWATVSCFLRANKFPPHCRGWKPYSLFILYTQATRKRQ